MDTFSCLLIGNFLTSWLLNFLCLTFILLHQFDILRLFEGFRGFREKYLFRSYYAVLGNFEEYHCQDKYCYNNTYVGRNHLYKRIDDAMAT